MATSTTAALAVLRLVSPARTPLHPPPSQLSSRASSPLSSPFLGNKLVRSKWKQGERECKCKCQPGIITCVGGDHVVVSVVDVVKELFLGVGVGLPCTVMECGDIMYRSTLPRSSGLNVTPPSVLLAVAAVFYLWATPCVAPGFWDMFVLAFIERLFRPIFRKDDFVLGRKLGEGAFGVVSKVSMAKKSSAKQGDLVLKKATEYGAVEIWMNERVRRACASSCAHFLYGFLKSSSKEKGGEYWLIWRFDGEATLADLMLSKEFPYNVETMILGEVQDLPKGFGKREENYPNYYETTFICFRWISFNGHCS